MGKYKLHPDDIREMSPEERREKLQELKAELLREMTSKSVAGVPENPGRVREIKRNIARILTIEREEELKKIREAEKR
ncbi:50S ribosomal protein L29 [Methanopyrus sp.]